MKKQIWIVFLAFIFTVSCVVYVPRVESGGRGRGTEADFWSYERGLDTSDFYEYLSPHGAWVNYPPYGYVWIPRDVPIQWRPYTHGRWAWTDYGWTWISDYEWGWIPFHYGRWQWERRLGWFWVPDTVWGPAWVTWRRGGLYIGWAPLPPGAEFVAGVGMRPRYYEVPDRFWIFLDSHNFLEERLGRFVLPYERNVTIIRYTVCNTNIFVRNNRIVNEGVSIDEVERYTRRRVDRYQLKDARRPGSARLEGREVYVYKPPVTKNEISRPKNVLRKEDAEEKISRRELGEIQERVSGSEQENLLRNQEREKRLLEESQRNEVNELRRRTEEEKKLVRSREEKQRLDNEYRTKSSELRRNHEKEKSELSSRQQEEKKKVDRSREPRKKSKD